MQESNEGSHTVQNLNTILLRKLSFAVNGHAAAATFACGGSVPVSDIPTGKFGPGQQNVFPSVTLRWDNRSYTAASLSFPLPLHDAVSHRRLQDLCLVSQPATFGIGGRDVLDEDYRKASKLDPSMFSTNFHPHDCGIVDSIQQILLPSTVKGGQGIGIGPHGVRAQLHKLNIYSAPSGKFLSHVDTPRGPMQFGSLVVCLPCSHQGGTLRVKHRGQTMDFAWADNNPQAIQWAAFYGDCEHEVLEVTRGHRVTLTYNLYYTWIGRLAQPVSTPYHLPLYGVVRDILQEPTFMSQGGILGFFCHHQYAHSQESGRKSIPMAFKGVDLAIYSVFQALGLKVGIHPTIENRSHNMGGLSAKDLMSPSSRHDGDPDGDHVENCLAAMATTTDQNCDEDEPDYYNERSYGGESEEQTTIVGTKLHGPTFDESYEEESEEPVSYVWPHQKVPNILWMNEPTHKDFAHAGLAYGNEATLNYQFSAASILVVVPASSNRMNPPPTPSIASMSAETRAKAPSSATSTAFDTPLGSEPSVAGATSPAGSSADANLRQPTPMSGTSSSAHAMAGWDTFGQGLEAPPGGWI